jgi:polyferredoxin
MEQIGDATKCNNCGACGKRCPMDIRITDYIQQGQRVLSTECIVCFECVNVCARGALDMSLGPDEVDFLRMTTEFTARACWLSPKWPPGSVKCESWRRTRNSPPWDMRLPSSVRYSIAGYNSIRSSRAMSRRLSRLYVIIARQAFWGVLAAEGYIVP